MSGFAKKVAAAALAAIMQVSLCSSVLAASAPSYLDQSAATVQFDRRHGHDNSRDWEKIRRERQREHDRRMREERKRHEREMRRHDRENEREWRERQRREKERHDRRVREIGALLIGVAIGTVIK